MGFLYPLFFLFILLIQAFILGFIVASIIAFFSKGGFKKNWRKFMLIPFGCTGVVILITAVIALFSWLLIEPQDADQNRYQEIFGYSSTITNDRMLSNHQGTGQDRLIYMRAEVSETERDEILSIMGLQSSSKTVNDIVTSGKEEGFSWWLRGTTASETCINGTVKDISNYNRWSSIVILYCPQDEKHTHYKVGRTDYIYIIARGRTL